MKHAKVILVAALLTASVAVRAEEPQKVTFDPSAWLVFGAFQNRGEFDSRELPRFVIAETQNGVAGVKPEESGYLVRQTRLRFGLTIPTDSYLAGATLKGLVEADFLGGTPSAASTVDPAIPRLRHAYMAANWKKAGVTLLVGQTWGVAMPAPSGWASSLSHLAVPRFGGAGFLYRRAPQVRLAVDAPAGALNVSAAVAVLSAGDIASASSGSAGNQSYMPNFEGRLAGSYKTSGPLKEVTVGVNGHLGEERWTTLPGTATALAAAVTTQTEMYGVDARLDFGQVAVVGGLWAGQNLDNWNALDGIGVGTIASRFGVLIDNTDPAFPIAFPVKSRGAWVQAQATPVKALQIVAGLGFENPDDNTLAIPGTAIAAGAVQRNTQYSAGLIWGVTSKWRVSFEATRYITFIHGTPNDTITGNQFEIGSLLSI